MPVMSAEDVGAQIQFGTKPADWTVFQPPKFPWIVLALYGLCYVAIFPLILTAIYGFVFWLWLDPQLVQSSFWPMYTTYPILAVIVVVFPFFLIWLVWRLETRDRDTLLVLLPQGCVQYKPWRNKSKRRATVIEYARTEEIVAQKKLAGIVVTIKENDGKQETLFLTRKYGGISPDTTVHEDIARCMVDAWRSWNEHILPTENERPGDPRLTPHEWLHEGKVSRRRLLQISGGIAIAGSVASVGATVVGLIHWDSRTLFVDQGHTNAVHFVSWSPDGTRISSAGWDRVAHSWEGNVGSSPLLTYRQKSNGVSSAAWSPDSERIVVDGDQGMLHILEASTGKIHLTYTAQQAEDNEVFTATWSPGGTFIASGDFLGIIQIWSPTTGKTRLNLADRRNIFMETPNDQPTPEEEEPDFRTLPLVYSLSGMREVTRQRDLVYKTLEDGTALAMDVYYPDSYDGQTLLPTVLFVHGDAPPEILRDAKDWACYIGWGELIAASGLAAVTFNHRSTEMLQKVYESADDVDDLVKHVRAHSRGLGIDPERLAPIGACAQPYVARQRICAAPFRTVGWLIPRCSLPILLMMSRNLLSLNQAWRLSGNFP